MNTTHTFSNTAKIITVGIRRFRVVTCALADVPDYLEERGLEPHKYMYFPQVFDEVLIPKRKAMEEDTSD